MRLRLLAFAGLLALGAGIAAAVLIARSPSARHPEPAAAHAAPRPKRHAKPKPRLVRGPHDSPVPILMYHVLAERPAGAAYPHLLGRPPHLAGPMKWVPP